MKTYTISFIIDGLGAEIKAEGLDSLIETLSTMKRIEYVDNDSIKVN